MAQQRPMPDYYHNHKSPPLAKIYYPSAKEFSDPFTYVDSIRKDGRHYGVIKIVPPKDFKPPFALARSLEFRPRAQRICMTDVFNKEHHQVIEKLRIYYENEPTKRKVPKFDGKELNFTLYSLAINKHKIDENIDDINKWIMVAKDCCIQEKHAVSLRYYYCHVFGEFLACLRCEQKLRTYAFEGVDPSDDIDDLNEDEEDSGSETNDDLVEENQPSPPEIVDFPIESDETLRSNKELIESVVDASFFPNDDGKAISNDSDIEIIEDSQDAPQLEPMFKKSRLSEDGIANDDVSLDAPSDLERQTETESSPPVIITDVNTETYSGRPSRQAKTTFLAKIAHGFDEDEDDDIKEIKESINNEHALNKEYSVINLSHPVFEKEEVLPELPEVEKTKHLLPTVELQKQYKIPYPIPKINHNLPKEFVIPATTGRNFFDAPECFTLQSFREHADKFKALYFKKKRPTEVKVVDVEREFWKNMGNLNSDLYAFYGADLNSGNFGSGFPILPKTVEEQSKLDPYFFQYAKHPWNLNNMPIDPKSAFSHLEANISGMTIPWVYVGMCFSLFCWHVEDHWTYSINYMHEGETKVWYGIPERDAGKFDKFMQSLAPESFVESKDLLHHMNTMIHPEILRENGIEVFTVHQNIGEIVITFPRAYHAGFNAGYNVAEAVNFAPYDWLQAGRRCLSNYAKVGRGCVFSHDLLVFNMAKQRHKLDQKMFNAVVMEYRAILNRETYYRKCLKERGFQFKMCPVNLADIVTNEDFRSCVKCNTLLYSSAIICKHMKAACPMHYNGLCKECPESQYRFGYSEDMISLKKTFNKFYLPLDIETYEELCVNLLKAVKNGKIKFDDNIMDVLLIAVIKNWKSDKIFQLYSVISGDIKKRLENYKHNMITQHLESKKTPQKTTADNSYDNTCINHGGFNPEKQKIIEKAEKRKKQLEETLNYTRRHFNEKPLFVKDVKKLRMEIDEIVRRYRKNKIYTEIGRIRNIIAKKKPKRIKENKLMKVTIPPLTIIKDTDDNGETSDKIRGEFEMPEYRIPDVYRRRFILSEKGIDAKLLNPLGIYRLFKLLNNFDNEKRKNAWVELNQMVNKCTHSDDGRTCCNCLLIKRIITKIKDDKEEERSLKVINDKDNSKEANQKEHARFLEKLNEIETEYKNLKSELDELDERIIDQEVEPFLLRMDLLSAADVIPSYPTVNKLRDKIKSLELRVPLTHYTNYTFNDLSELHTTAHKYIFNDDVIKSIYYIEELFVRGALFEEKAENLLCKKSENGLLTLYDFGNNHLHSNTWFGEKNYMVCFKKMEEEEKIAKDLESFLRNELHTIDSLKLIDSKLTKSTVLNNGPEHKAIQSVIPSAMKIFNRLYELFHVSDSYYRVLDILYGRHDLKLLCEGGHYPAYKPANQSAEYIIDAYLTNRSNSLKYISEGQLYQQTYIPEMVRINHETSKNLNDPRVLCNCGVYCESDELNVNNSISCLICGVRNHIQCAVWNEHFSDIKEGTYYCQRCLRSRKPLLSDLEELIDDDMLDLNEYFVLKNFVREQKEIFKRFYSLNLISLTKDEFLRESAVILSSDVTDGKSEIALLENPHYSDYFNDIQIKKWLMVKQFHDLYENNDCQRIVIFEYRQPRKKAFSNKTVLREPVFFEAYGVACKNEGSCIKPKGRPIAFRCRGQSCPYFCHFECIKITPELMEELKNFKCNKCKCRKN